METGEARVSMRIVILLLWLEVFLSPSGLSQARLSQHLSSPEVVVPLKVTSKGRASEVPGWLSYSIQLGGQRQIIHMRVKKFLVSRHLPVFTYTDQHALQEDQPFVPDDCYYHGYVQGVSGSLVALSTCSGGFRGMLQINDLAYEIEPIRHSTTFEHLVYKIDSDEVQFPPMRCGLTNKDAAHQQLGLEETEKTTLKQNSTDNWWAHSWFLELVVVVDRNFFIYSQSNFSKVQEDVYLVINIVDSIYQQLDTYVILIAIEIWNHQNVFSMISIEQVLEDFAQWKQVSLSRLKCDAAHIFIKNSLISTLGIAYVAGICRPPIDCAVNNFKEDPWSLFALTVAHELGHTLGMQHDQDFCWCGQSGCIMSAVRMLAERFTNCSYAAFTKTTLNQGSCLHNLPSTGEMIMLKRCGNYVIEEGEECDCGSIRQCEQDPCCLLNCTLSPGSACAFGLCCKGCKLMPSGALCRPQVGECDLPEWCNGTSHQCPEDGYVQDGNPCGDKAYCYKKSCSSHDRQCREIFGEDAKSASQECYKKINSQGSRYGHCGLDSNKYLKCNTSDIFCGRVQCEDVSVIPNLTEHTTVHQLQINFTSCWGTDYHLGITTPDIGLVKDGSVCGPGKICINQKCVDMPLVSQACQTDTCHTRGVCNNKQHCHCSQGWAPPNCMQKGDGGSIDSGPPPSKNGQPQPQPQANVSYLFLLWLIPLIALFLSHFLVLCMKKKRKKEEVEEVEKEKEKEEEVEKEKEKEEEVEKEKEKEEPEYK